MNESSQAIVAVKREVQLSERQRQVQERQEQGIPVDEWCASLGISKGAYYHRLRKVREYMCQQMVETHPNWECDLRSGNKLPEYKQEKVELRKQFGLFAVV